MKLFNVAVDRPVGVFVCSLFLVALGWLSFARMPVALLPAQVGLVSTPAYIGPGALVLPAPEAPPQLEQVGFFMLSGSLPLPELGQIAQSYVVSRFLQLAGVAQVAIAGDFPASSRAREDGTPGVAVRVFKGAGANAVGVGPALSVAVVKLKNELPAGVLISEIFNQSEQSRSLVSGLRQYGLNGIVLVVLVLFVLFFDWRSTTIVATVIPIVIISAFIPLYLGGITINIMSLAGLVVGVGLFAGSSILVMEHSSRHIEQGVRTREAILMTGREIMRPVLSSMLVLLVVLGGIVLVPRAEGPLFADLAWALGAALLLSLLAAGTIVPALAAQVFSVRLNHDNKYIHWGYKVFKISLLHAIGVYTYRLMGLPKPIFLGIITATTVFGYGGKYIAKAYTSVYQGGMHFVLGRWYLQLLLFLLCGAGVFYSLQQVPQVQSRAASLDDQIEFDITLPGGTGLAQADQLAQRLEQTLSEFSESYGVVVSAQRITFNIRLPQLADLSPADRTPAEIVATLQAQAGRLPGAQVTVARSGSQLLKSSRVLSSRAPLEFLREHGALLAMILLIVYLVVAAMFESFLHALVIMLALPLTLPGALGALLLSGYGLSAIAGVGFKLLIGISISQTIILVAYIRRQELEGDAPRAQAIVTAALTRTRPILMTMLAVVLGCLPLALGAGTGRDLYQPLAVILIGGLLSGTILTLIFTPVSYSLLESIADAMRAWGRKLGSVNN